VRDPTPIGHWSELPAGFQPASLARAGAAVLIGGSKPDGSLAVLQGHVDGGTFVLDDDWAVPPLPRLVGFVDPGQTPALVSAAVVDGVPTALVDVQELQGGSWGHWLHPLGTQQWEFLPNAEIESDIGVGPFHVGGGAWFTVGSPEAPSGDNLWRFERGPDLAPYPAYEEDRAQWSRWRPARVPLPSGTVARDLGVTPSGRWLAANVSTGGAASEVVIYEWVGQAYVVRRRIPRPWSLSVGVTEDHLVVLERTEPPLLWWAPPEGTPATAGLPLPGLVGGLLDVRGSFALVTGETQSFVVDLASGTIVAALPRGPGDLWSVLADGAAVFVTDGSRKGLPEPARIGVFPLPGVGAE
jgi:hypothetical protein